MAEDQFEDAIRVALARESAGLEVGAADVDRLRRDADVSGGSVRHAGWSSASRGLLTTAACLLLLGLVLLSVRVGDQDPVALGGTTPNASEALQPATVEVLVDRSFRSVGQLPGAPIPDAVVTLRFGAGDGRLRSQVEFGANSAPGCNGLGGTGSLNADGMLISTDTGSSAMGCGEPSLAQDAWLSELVLSRPRLLVADSRLELHSLNTVVMFEEVPQVVAPPTRASESTTDAKGQPATPAALAGRTFRSVGELPGAPILDAVMTLRFGEPETAAADLLIDSEPGCNQINIADLDLDSAGLLAESALSQTDAGCAGAEQAQDGWLIDVVSSRPRFLLDGPLLSVETRDGPISFLDEDPDAVQPRTGDPTCDAVVEQVATSLEQFLASIDPQTQEPDGSTQDDVGERLDTDAAAAGCDQGVVRREVMQVLLPRLLARHGQEWLTERQTALTAVVIVLNPEEFGLVSPIPVPTGQPPAAIPTPTPTR